MTAPTQPRSFRRDVALGWTALGASTLAVFAWAACCVLPVALGLAGVGLAGTTLLAGQRTWLTLFTLLALGAGWWTIWRRRKARSADLGGSPPRLAIFLLSAATILTLVALAWGPFIESRALALVLGGRG